MALEKLDLYVLEKYALRKKLRTRSGEIIVKCHHKNCSVTHKEKPFKYMARGRTPKFFHENCIRTPRWKAMQGGSGKPNKSKKKKSNGEES